MGYDSWPYEAVQIQKRTQYTRALAFLIAGVALLFLATLVYLARAISSFFKDTWARSALSN